ncbi:MAG: hypothetical protein WDN31_13470 [Hyphomicrobium sp.]
MDVEQTVHGVEAQVGVAGAEGGAGVRYGEDWDDPEAPCAQLADAAGETVGPVGRAGKTIVARNGEAKLLQPFRRGC